MAVPLVSRAETSAAEVGVPAAASEVLTLDYRPTARGPSNNTAWPAPPEILRFANMERERRVSSAFNGT